MNTTIPSVSLIQLRDLLRGLASGPVSELASLAPLLAKVWDELMGSGEERMAGYKILGRMKKVNWDPPILKFEIIRHGPTAKGSSRAPRHIWWIDVNKATASCVEAGWEQVYPMSPRWNYQKDVAEIANLIISRSEDPRLEWKSSDKVTVTIADVVPEGGAKQTTTARRKKFRNALTETLKSHNWNACTKPNWYEYQGPPLV